jgi:hypothetical protein
MFSIHKVNNGQTDHGQEFPTPSLGLACQNQYTALSPYSAYSSPPPVPKSHATHDGSVTCMTAEML